MTANATSTAPPYPTAGLSYPQAATFPPQPYQYPFPYTAQAPNQPLPAPMPLVQAAPSDIFITNTSYFELTNYAFNKVVTSSYKSEGEVYKIVQINDEVWVLGKNGVIDVLYRNCAQKRCVRIDSAGTKVKAKGAVLTGDNHILVASAKGLLEIDQHGVIVNQVSPASFLDVTIDSRHTSDVYGLIEGEPAAVGLYRAIAGAERRSSWQWVRVLSIANTNTKKLCPKLLVHNRLVYIVKNHFLADNHVFRAEFRLDDAADSLQFEYVRKKDFHQHPRLCSVDSQGNVLIGEWNDGAMHVFNDDVMTKIQSCKSTSYFKYGLLLDSGCIMVLSDSFPSKVYLLEPRRI